MSLTVGKVSRALQLRQCNNKYRKDKLYPNFSKKKVESKFIVLLHGSYQ